MTSIQTRELTTLPDAPEAEIVYIMPPVNPSGSYYEERTNRHMPWITADEQKTLGSLCVGVAGCGGMGGLLATTLARTGIGQIRIADNEVFDVSNINRQAGARRGTVGLSKALVTAGDIRAITDDLTLLVYPEGITEATVDHFLDGVDIVADEVEFWAVGARILLHQRARARGIPIINCNTVGFGTRLFRFTPTGTTIEACLGFDLDSAYSLQKKIASKTASAAEVKELMEAILQALVPELPEYSPNDPNYSTRDLVVRRLRDEMTAPIIAPNPVMAAGFMADRMLLELLSLMKSGKHPAPDANLVQRTVVEIPEPPGYLYFDAAMMVARAITNPEEEY